MADGGVESLFDKAEKERLVEWNISGNGQIQFRRNEVSTLQMLNGFRKEGDSGFCDVILEVEGHRHNNSLPAHRNILAANSRFFYSMFNSGMRDSTDKRLTLKILSNSAMNTILEYFYTGIITISMENVEELLEASSFLLIDPVKKACEQVLKSGLKKDNCFNIKRLARKFDCAELLKNANLLIDKSFHTIIEGECTAEFLDLSFQEIADVISRDEVMVVSERDVFLAVLKWVRHDEENRKDRLQELIKLVRFGSIPKSFLKGQLNIEPLLKEEQSCRLIKQLTEDDYTQLSQRPSAQVKKAIVGIGNISFIYEKESNQVRLLPRLQDFQMMLHNASLVTLGNSVFIFIAWNDIRTCSLAHDRHTFLGNLRWDAVPSFAVQRHTYTISALKGYVYAIGGIYQHLVHNTVERFDPDENKWCAVASLKKSRYDLASVATEDSIYAIGGSVSLGFTGKEVVAVVEKFDPVKNSWTLVAPMPTKRASLSTVYNHGKIYCVGGVSEQYNQLANCDIYDVVLDEWISARPLPSLHSSPIQVTSAIAVDDEVAVFSPSLNGSFDSFLYSTSTDTWDCHKVVKPAQGTCMGLYMLCNMVLPSFYLRDLPIVNHFGVDVSREEESGSSSDLSGVESLEGESISETSEDSDESDDDSDDESDDDSGDEEESSGDESDW